MKIIVAGDFVPNGRVAENINNNQSFIDDKVVDIIRRADYSIVNLEAPVVMSAHAMPIEKVGPNLYCTENSLDSLIAAGFTCVTLANNHFRDYGDFGVKDTLSVCQNKGIDSVGGGVDFEEASAILYKQIGGKTLSVINCCEHEFSIASETLPGSNPLNTVKQYYQILEAKRKSDYVLVIVHGGHEKCQYPSLRMQETYRFFIDIGADAVVNHHQHCYSGYETYKDKPIFYGLGNFCFDSFCNVYGENWHYGYLLELEFNDDTDHISFDLYPYTQCIDTPEVKLIEERSAFDSHISQINSVINDREQLMRKLSEFYLLSTNQIETILEPRRARSFMRFFIRGKMPRFLLNWRRKYQLINMIECESHRDRLLYILKIM